MSKTAIIVGATGLTGSYLLDMLLESENYERVKIFVRKSSGKKHNKLEEIICDVLNLEKYADEFFADEVFCCTGTTKAKTPDEKLYKAIDFGIPASVAKLCEKNKIKTLSLISAINANKNSKFLYAKTKGEMEEKVLSFNIPNIFIYRPSLIYGKREDFRIGEKLAIYLFKVLNLFLKGRFAKHRPISGEDLAKTLFLGINKYNGKKIIYLDK